MLSPSIQDQVMPVFYSVYVYRMVIEQPGDNPGFPPRDLPSCLPPFKCPLSYKENILEYGVKYNSNK